METIEVMETADGVEQLVVPAADNHVKEDNGIVDDVGEESYDETVHFILEIKSQRCIWDIRDPEHYFKERIQEAWETVSESSRLSVSSCKDKWRRLRDKYKKDVYSYQSLSKPSTFKYYDDMQFLNIGKMKTKKFTVRKNSHSSTSKSKSNNSIKKSDNVNTIDSTINGDANRDDSDQSPIDGDYLFLVSLLPSMKKLPEMSKMQLKLNIQNIVYNELRAQQNGISNES